MVLLAACGHGQKVTRTSTVAACDGAAVTEIGRPVWAAVADYDRDGDTDLLLLDVHGVAPAMRVAVVPLRAGASGFCRDAAILVWTGALAMPRRLQLRAEDVDADGLADLVAWNSSTGDFAVLRGTGDARAPFTRTGVTHGSIDLARQELRQRWESVDVGARGRLFVTTPELVVVLSPGQRPPRSGRRRHPTPFRIDYAVYLDFTLADTHGFRALVVGRGSRLAVRAGRSEPYRWEVLRLE